MKLEEGERRAYEWHIEELRYQASMYRSSFFDGRMEGKQEGLEEGVEKGIEKSIEEGKVTMAKIMKQAGEPMEKIMQYTQLTREEVERVYKELCNWSS